MLPACHYESVLGGVGCRTDADCRGEAVCVSGYCVDEGSHTDVTNDTDPGCTASELECNGRCIDPLVDPRHCGECSNACSAPDVCSAGSCALVCPGTQRECQGGCFDTQASTQHCGQCGNSCDGGQACSAGECTATCSAGQEICNGVCRDTQVDPLHCGTCENACEPGEVCSQRECALSCGGGLEQCAGICRDLDSDRAHCGECDKGCGDGEVCVDGDCALSCGGGLEICGGVCRDLETDRAHCGECDQACNNGQICLAGECEVSCPAGLETCNNSCTDYDFDPANCGSCGRACQIGQVCTNGDCEVSCGPGLVECDGVCINPNLSREFCGAEGSCLGGEGGEACADGFVCSNGACQLSCQGTLVKCGASCIDPQINRAFCGASLDCAGANDGTVCSGDQVCHLGACQLLCPTGTVKCGNACVDPLNNPLFCGASADCSGPNDGEVCLNDAVCVQGACALNCPGSLVKCGNSCVDPVNNPNFCGASGTCTGASAGSVCTGDTVCVASQCQLLCPGSLVKCGNACVDAQNNPNFCGASGTCTNANAGSVCTGEEVCVEGACRFDCPGDLIKCDGKCIDPGHDPDYCGAAFECKEPAERGMACDPGQACFAGVCTSYCGAGLTVCDRICRDLQSDPDHCNACDQACDGAINAQGVCDGGACTIRCAQGFGNCDDDVATGCELDLSEDDDNCGSCANVCKVDEVCVAGECEEI